MAELTLREVGRVEGFFVKPSVARIALTGALAIGDLIYVKGFTSDFQQRVESMEVDHAVVQEGHAGQSIGVKVCSRCRKHDVVYQLIPSEQ